MIEESQGFTKAGIIRLDDSIRTYVYCVLGSQAQTRSSILTSKEMQQYFVDLFEQNIKVNFQYQKASQNMKSLLLKPILKLIMLLG